LETTGLANRIYATEEVVLRVATDHPEAIPDALTESVAAPAGRHAGILTPELLAFDDSRTIVDRPFSLLATSSWGNTWTGGPPAADSRRRMAGGWAGSRAAAQTSEVLRGPERIPRHAGTGIAAGFDASAAHGLGAREWSDCSRGRTTPIGAQPVCRSRWRRCVFRP